MKEIENGKSRVIIEGVTPEIDEGRFPIKRCLGESVCVEADIFADGHDVLSAVLLYRKEGDAGWAEAPMQFLSNDRWRGSFVVTELGRYQYKLAGWKDWFKTWQQNLTKKYEASQDVSVDFLEGAQLIEQASQRAVKRDVKKLLDYAKKLRSDELTSSAKFRLSVSTQLSSLIAKYPDRQAATVYPEELAVVVDSEKACFSSWYEMFPRSCAPVPGQHGTFRDCEKRLAYIAEMGFDVLYLPPIHPIGQTNRKGKNNSPTAREGEPGTPWAIGSSDGGHKSIHPELGTLADFRSLVVEARKYGIDIALDIAYQCSPDHPYVKEHPEWFRWRPDGTVQYAENPPKKYQDIYPLEFETENWKELWEELKSIILFWVEQGVRIFRVDNPHTKPFAFWEWMISGVKEEHPDVIFLAEAFTRPKIMYQLAKLGFTQSYTYFSWRNTKQELTEYLTELTQTEVSEFFRPNFWPNTPDILSDCFRDGGRPAFMSRLVLAATLNSNYGIYGPAYELGENRRKDIESEEYLNSEKYEMKHWNIDSPGSLKNLIGLVNRIRKENTALQGNLSLQFHPVDNDRLICYSKCSGDLFNVVLVIVSLDYQYRQSGWVSLNLDELGLRADQPFQVYDMLNDATYQWQGTRNYVELNPRKPAHIFRVTPQRPSDVEDLKLERI